MIPRLAALSIAEMTARICSVFGVSEERACFCIERRRVTTLRLRSDRFNVWRARLTADFVLAIAIEKFMDVNARGRKCDCQEWLTRRRSRTPRSTINARGTRPAPRREEFCF